MDEAERWKLFGELVRQRREELGISKREAARRAGVSDSQWGHYEKGARIAQGARLLPNPSDRHLEAVADAIGLDPHQVFTAAGRVFVKRPHHGAVTQPRDLEGRLSRVEERLARLEAVIDRLAAPGQP